MIVAGPLDEFDLANQQSFTHRHSAIFAAVSPAPQRPILLRQIRERAFLISIGLIFLNSSARDDLFLPLVNLILPRILTAHQVRICCPGASPPALPDRVRKLRQDVRFD